MYINIPMNKPSQMSESDSHHLSMTSYGLYTALSVRLYFDKNTNIPWVYLAITTWEWKSKHHGTVTFVAGIPLHNGNVDKFCQTKFYHSEWFTRDMQNPQNVNKI